MVESGPEAIQEIRTMKDLEELFASNFQVSYLLLCCSGLLTRTRIFEKIMDHPKYRDIEIYDGNYRWLYYRGRLFISYYPPQYPISIAVYLDLPDFGSHLKRVGILFKYYEFDDLLSVFDEDVEICIGVESKLMRAARECIHDHVVKADDIRGTMQLKLKKGILYIRECEDDPEILEAIIESNLLKGVVRCPSQ